MTTILSEPQSIFHATPEMVQWLASPLPRYIALYTEMGDGGHPAVEVTGEGYERSRVAFDMSGALITNVGLLRFPAARSDWGTITHLGIGRHRVKGHGNIYFYAPLGHQLRVFDGDSVAFPESAIRLMPTAWLLAQIAAGRFRG